MTRPIDQKVYARIAAQGVQDSVHRMTGYTIRPRRVRAWVRFALWSFVYLAIIGGLLLGPSIIRGQESARTETHRLD